MPYDPNHPISPNPGEYSQGPFDEDPLDDEFPDFEETNRLQPGGAQPPFPSSSPMQAPSSPIESIKKEDAPLEHVEISHIPLKVQLEIARISVSFEELQKLKPGSRLPIDINPRIVNLVVGGKSIGQGEIVEVGEIVGVKILELYK